MRRAVSLCLLLGLFTHLAAQTPERIKEPPVRRGPALQAGDPAPALRASQWLQGAEVRAFAKGKVSVVGFWATWSGPGLLMLTQLGELQTQYRDKGVTFIAYSAHDETNPREAVAALVEKRGPKLGYSFAYADDRTTSEAWMKAAGRGGIPCVFVVDKDGKIAYIGHPMCLDLVLPKVVAGTWTAADREAVAKIEPEVAALFKTINVPGFDFGFKAATGLKALTAFETKHPEVPRPFFLEAKLTLLVRSKKFDEAKKLAEEALTRSVRLDDPTTLGMVSFVLRDPAAKGRKELAELAVKVAEAGLKLAGDKDSAALLTLAEAHFAASHGDKAKEYGAKALTAAAKEPAGTQAHVERQVRKFDGKGP